MDLIQIYEQISSADKMGILVVLVILAGLIKIPKLEINIWEFIAEKIGQAINKNLIKQMNTFSKNLSELNINVASLDEQLKEHLILVEHEKIKNARQRILKFNDEIIQCKFHSLEHYEEIITDIDMYESYCLEHPEYPNNKANIAIKNIKNAYILELENQKKYNSN